MGDKPKADVLWWDAHNFSVLCPHCKKLHHHGMNRYGTQSRVSHCKSPEDYICCFPFNERGQVAYEIGKKRARFVNICTPSGTDSDEMDSLSYEFTAKARVTIDKEAESRDAEPNFYRDTRETRTIDLKHGFEPVEVKTVLFALSDCVEGKTDAVKNYPESSAEAQIFLHGRANDGNTTLIMAAAEENIDMVSLLLEHGAEVNAINRGGRSALMEAALWGRLGNVKLLLDHGANKDCRDEENLRAIDLARATQRNRDERYWRAGGDIWSDSDQGPVYREDTFKRDIDRQSIVRLLGGEDRKSSIVYGSPPAASQYEDYSFKRSPTGDSIVLRGPIENYPISTPRKTVARLERGGKFLSVAAMSGWSHDPWQSVIVSGRQWTEDVFYISSIVGHTLTSNDRLDQGRPGRYNACHAEKQLIADFISRHIFLPRDTELELELEAKIKSMEDQCVALFLLDASVRDLALLRRTHKDLQIKLFDADDVMVGYDESGDKIKALRSQIESTEDKLEQLNTNPGCQRLIALEKELETLKQHKVRYKALIDLANAQPPVSLTEANILVSSPVCADCVDFTNKVNETFGLSIKLFAAC
ncbi:hypothetical protein DTO271G3_2211 [Paecilomyces variotii]|nr:hypothetical protein DTO271G3_2211 [Paecilomyces variotii]